MKMLGPGRVSQENGRHGWGFEGQQLEQVGSSPVFRYLLTIPGALVSLMMTSMEPFCKGILVSSQVWCCKVARIPNNSRYGFWDFRKGYYALKPFC